MGRQDPVAFDNRINDFKFQSDSEDRKVMLKALHRNPTVGEIQGNSRGDRGKNKPEKALYYFI